MLFIDLNFSFQKASLFCSREGKRHFSQCLGRMKSGINQTLKDLLHRRTILIPELFILGFSAMKTCQI
jgi:hypothetical protein